MTSPLSPDPWRCFLTVSRWGRLANDHGSGVKCMGFKSKLTLARTERKIMGFTFWFIMLILFHVALLFMVPWE